MPFLIEATMPLQNRVLPTGDIVSISAPCTLTGNRGIIHTEGRILGAARWTHKAWICCVLDWQGRTRDVMTGRNWTELFSLMKRWPLPRDTDPVGIAGAKLTRSMSMLGRSRKATAPKHRRWTQFYTRPVSTGIAPR